MNISKNRVSALMYTFFIIFIIFEISISFFQHKNQPLDGDLANVVVPSSAYKVVLENPLGLPIILKDSVYANPNRFFAHFSTFLYFRHVPDILQKYGGIEPVESIYMSTALAKTFIQIFLLFFLSGCISLTLNPLKKEFILAAAIIAPLFQTYGYNVVMGIIDPSITYTFFYALSFGFLLWFFYPILKMIRKEMDDISVNWFLTLVVLSFVVSFNSALNPAIILLITPICLGYFILLIFNREGMRLKMNTIKSTVKQLPPRATGTLIFISILSLYSLYIGMNNSENLWESIPLIERYFRLPVGLFSIFTQKLGPVILLAILIINYLILIRHRKIEKSHRIVFAFRIFLLLAVIYLLLLPFGGYRSYRELIIRRDTFLPIWLGMIILYGYSSIYLLQTSKGLFNKLYILLVILVSFSFFNADLSVPDKKKCEKNAIELIADSKRKVVELPDYCSVLSWLPITSAKESAINIELLQLWNVIQDDKLYYYDSEK